MDRTNAWLTILSTVEGDIEPPPSPNIPTNYLAKPRKQRRTPLLTPLSHPIPLLKRKRNVLTDIACPNQLPTGKLPLPPPKRRRPTEALNMTDQARSPSRRRYPARSKASVGDGAMDVDAAPRQPRRNSRRPVQALGDTAIPALTPSTSENQVEGRYQPEPSVAESSESKVSKRSVSPAKRMVDLRVADKKVVQKSIRSRADVPEGVQELYKTIQGIATFARDIVPRGIEVGARSKLVFPVSRDW